MGVPYMGVGWLAMILGLKNYDSALVRPWTLLRVYFGQVFKPWGVGWLAITSWPFLLGQWLNLGTFWDYIFSRENNPFKLFFQGPLAEWASQIKSSNFPRQCSQVRQCFGTSPSLFLTEPPPKGDADDAAEMLRYGAVKGPFWGRWEKKTTWWRRQQRGGPKSSYNCGVK